MLFNFFAKVERALWHKVLRMLWFYYVIINSGESRNLFV